MPAGGSCRSPSSSICSLPKRATERLPPFRLFSEFATQPGAAGDPEPLGDVAHARAVMGKAQHLSQVSHGQLPLGGHSVLLDDVRRVMPELLPRGSSERGMCPVIDWNGVRLHSGMLSGFKSEYLSGLRRNPQTGEVRPQSAAFAR
jgi:hypothetical protein